MYNMMGEIEKRYTKMVLTTVIADILTRIAMDHLDNTDPALLGLSNRHYQWNPQRIAVQLKQILCQDFLTEDFVKTDAAGLAYLEAMLEAIVRQHCIAQRIENCRNRLREEWR
ncbi:hypothetical protein CCR95_22405 [Thiocystis minor]|uniref:hypothetical protein n=1 Tax=Thiocystis minor TaxID=61597 RepID=UPI0019127BAD|nr:hypothetical protein [Thiocystis minor]MBK5966751.1 hypothetical protein [Thiocystis minor]